MSFSMALQASSTLSTFLHSAGLSLPTVLFTAGVVLFLLTQFIKSSSPKDKAGISSPKWLYNGKLANYVSAIYPFFIRRNDFLSWGFQAAGESMYQFNLLNRNVIVLSGETARREFLTEKNFDLTEGFRILTGSLPEVPGMLNSEDQQRRIRTATQRLVTLQKPEQLANFIPKVLKDCQVIMDKWGKSGTMEPHDSIYELVFHLSVRTLSCDELADDYEVTPRLKKLYDMLDDSVTPATTLTPWIPTWAMLKKFYATKKILDIVSGAVNRRLKSKTIKNDTFQILLDNNDEYLVLVGFTVGLLVAGARATGTTASWLATYLAGNPEWHAKARAEIQALLEDVADDSKDAGLASRLAKIPLDAWENQTPVIDSLIRETLRVAQPHNAMRRNLGPDTFIDGKLIPSGSFLVYPFSDVHLDAELYPDPWKFDPTRTGPAVETSHGYIGFGGGKRICAGQRLARVNLKCLTAMMVMGYDLSIVDGQGKPAPTPLPNWNDTMICRPTKGSFGLKFEKTDLQL